MSDVTGAGAARGEGRETLVTASQTVAQPTGGPPAHPAPTRAAAGRFDWPCDRRDAHGPHTVREQMLTGPNEFEERECPGVKAHPTTMIGGGYDE